MAKHPLLLTVLVQHDAHGMRRLNAAARPAAKEESQGSADEMLVEQHGFWFCVSVLSESCFCEQ
jgi:hypothetical protein